MTGLPSRPQEEDVALLMLSLAHNREGLVPINPALNGRAQVLGIFFWTVM